MTIEEQLTYRKEQNSRLISENLQLKFKIIELESTINDLKSILKDELNKNTK